MRKELLDLQEEYLKRFKKTTLELDEAKRYDLNYTIVFGNEEQFIHYFNLYETMNYDMRGYEQTYQKILENIK